MSMIGIDSSVIDRVARTLTKRGIEFERIDVYDERYYPSKDVDAETAARYFLVMVAMDHRLSRPGKPYEACLEDGCYHGADLLYRLGAKKFAEDPSFFTPEKLERVSVDDVRSWLSVGAAEPPDPDVRAYLLRDLGVKLRKLYEGRVLAIIEQSSGLIYGKGLMPGFVDLLRVFRAYEDPVSKKALLLAKFLTQRGLFTPREQLDVAVDNHLTRIALRLGMVMISGELWSKIKSGIEVSSEEDVLIRMSVKAAYRKLSMKTGIDPGILDDHFWIMGRKLCVRDAPFCDKCIFKNVCLAYRNRSFMVNEHTYLNTWFY